MLESARDLVHSDEDMSRTISSMLDKTNKLMSQFHVVKKQMVGCYPRFLLLPSVYRLYACHFSTRG